MYGCTFRELPRKAHDCREDWERVDPFEALKQRDFAAAAAAVSADAAAARARDANGMSLLLLAIYYRARDVVDAVLAAGVEPDVFEAAALGDVDRLRALVTGDRARLDAQNVDGAMPLHLAAHFGHRDAVAALLRLGADVRAVSGKPFGNTALHAAVAGGHAALVDVLVAAGADVDARDHNGYAALHVAAANGNVACARALLARGADAAARGGDGKTPLDFAVERDEGDVAALLRAAAGAKAEPS